MISKVGERPDPATLGSGLEERDRRVLFEVLFQPSVERTWEEAESCLEFLRNRQIAHELDELERQIQAQPAKDELVRLLNRQNELRRVLSRKQIA